MELIKIIVSCLYLYVEDLPLDKTKIISCVGNLVCDRACLNVLTGQTLEEDPFCYADSMLNTLQFVCSAFYLTTHSTHFIYGYMASDIW